MNNIAILAEELRLHEGIKLITYPGPVTGEPHIAYGHFLGQDQTETELEILGLEEDLDDWEGFTITKEQAEALLLEDIQDAIESLAPKFTEDELMALDPQRFIALISMSFQMGGYKIQRGFPSFVAAIKNEDWDRAADEMMWSNGLKKQKRSAWYQQTPDRCQEMSDKMRHGSKTPQSDGTEENDIDLSSVSNENLLGELRRRLLGN